MSDEPFRTIIEPFRIHSVEPIRLTTSAERAAVLAAAGYNLAMTMSRSLGSSGRWRPWRTA